jgi:hypothetical protein
LGSGLIASNSVAVFGFLGLPMALLGGAVNPGCSLGLFIVEDLYNIIFLCRFCYDYHGIAGINQGLSIQAFLKRKLPAFANSIALRAKISAPPQAKPGLP